MEEAKQAAILIVMRDGDNVAVVGNGEGLPAGTRVESLAGAVLRETLVLLEDVPEGHKVALRDIPSGAPIRRYDEIIGYARDDIARGSWIDESLVELPPAPDLDGIALASAPPPRRAPIEGLSFEGYRNADGTVGIRNLLGIAMSVQCVSGVVENALQRIRDELLPRYPHVDGVVALRHPYGCGVAIEAPGAEIPVRTLKNLARNPNLGGRTLVVGLGCEKLSPSRVAEGDPPLETLILQDHLGHGAMVTAIMLEAERRLALLDARRRVTCPASELVVGLQCGGSDALSGVTANPALGHAADLLVRAGATVLFSEVTEVRDAVHLLAARAVDTEVGEALIREMRWYDDYLERGGVNRSANTTPGNKRGGLANIVEKALGSVAKSGSGPLDGVLGPGQRVDRKGLIFAATPASDFVCGTLQAASGIQLQVFTTGRGTPYGLELLPVIKVATRDGLAERWPDLIDLSAGGIARGTTSIERTGEELLKLILDVASGRAKTKAELLRIYNDLCFFNPAPLT